MYLQTNALTRITMSKNKEVLGIIVLQDIPFITHN